MSKNKCEYCDKSNTVDKLRGDDGVIEKDGKYHIFIEHYQSEVNLIENIKYCPMCGREL